MKKFTHLLTEINNKLDLPQPQKSRVLLEIADDMEEIYTAYLNRGLSEQEAENKTKDKFSFSEDAIVELIQIHSTTYRRWFDKLSQRAQTSWEKFLLFIIFALVLFTFAQTIYSTPFFISASRFIYPILLSLLVATILFIIKFYQFYLKKDHKITQLRDGLDWILYLCVAIIFFGASGYFGELYFSSDAAGYIGPFFFISFLIDSTSLQLSVEWMARNSSMMMTCCGSTMMTLLFWFILINKAGKIEEAEASILLED